MSKVPPIVGARMPCPLPSSATPAFQHHHPALLCFPCTKSEPSSWVEWWTALVGWEEPTGVAIQRGPAHGLNFDSLVPSAAHHQNHFVV